MTETTNRSRRPLVAGNWKMNTTVPDGLSLAQELMARIAAPEVDVVLLPPFVHLWPIAEVLRGSGFQLGAQNCAWAERGAFTGEIAAEMLAGWCNWVLVGHSERRHVFGESDSDVARKARIASDAGLGVMVAVGETEDERDRELTVPVVHRQLDAVFGGAEGLGSSAAVDWVVAYEPVWAIGTGRTASPTQAEEVCAVVRERLSLHLGSVAGQVRVLYGGSVTGANAAELFASPAIDGGLVGGASLKIDDFAAIVAAATQVVLPG